MLEMIQYYFYLEKIILKNVNYYLVLLDVAFKLSEICEALSTAITGVITSCQTNPPVSKFH